MSNEINVIAEMLTENTGTHFLDSGGAYGRSWQKNRAAGVDALKSAPSSVLSFRYGEISVTHNILHWLSERVTTGKDLDECMVVWERYLNLTRGDDWSYYDMREGFPEFFSRWSARREIQECDECEGCGETESATEEDENGEPLVLKCETCRGIGTVRGEIVAPTGIYGDGDPITENTYNVENMLSQDMLFTYWAVGERGSREEYIAVQIHGGADARGGYTRPKVFRCSIEDQGILDYARGTIYCGGMAGTGQIGIRGLGVGDGSSDHGEHFWTTDDAYHWYAEGSCGYGAQRQLEKYEVVILDADLHAENTSGYTGEEGDEIPDIVEGEKGKLYAKSWQKGYLCVNEDKDEGYCPHCGGTLHAGAY